MNTIALWHWHSSIFLSSYNSQPVYMSYNQKLNVTEAHYLIGFHSWALPWRNQGFLQWHCGAFAVAASWRSPCTGGGRNACCGTLEACHSSQSALWFMASKNHSPVIARVRIAWEGWRSQNKAKVVIEIIDKEAHFFAI